MDHEEAGKAIQVRPDRLEALDLLRGAAVAGMILVTSPGDWAFTYAPLRHADWNGWTAADMVFPAFLFGVGVAIGLSFPKPFDEPGARSRFWRRVARRIIALVLLGLALEATYNLAIGLGAPFLGKAGLANIRVPGILQRIALCYGFAAVLAAATSRRCRDGLFHLDARAIAGATLFLLVGYWLLLSYVPVPGYGAGRLDPEGNLGAYLDRALFTVPHLWPLGWAAPGGPVVYDPEGLLSTIPAAANTLLGVLAALALLRRPSRAPMLLAAAGALFIVAGLGFDAVLPINKRIWTSSFAVLSGGVSLLGLAGFALAARSRPAMRILTPLSVLGRNAILAFILSTLIGRVYGFPMIARGEELLPPSRWLLMAIQPMVGDPTFASLICAIIVLMVVTIALWPLDRRAIHFRL